MDPDQLLSLMNDPRSTIVKSSRFPSATAYIERLERNDIKWSSTSKFLRRLRTGRVPGLGGQTAKFRASRDAAFRELMNRPLPGPIISPLGGPLGETSTGLGMAAPKSLNRWASMGGGDLTKRQRMGMKLTSPGMKFIRRQSGEDVMGRRPGFPRPITRRAAARKYNQSVLASNSSSAISMAKATSKAGKGLRLGVLKGALKGGAVAAVVGGAALLAGTMAYQAANLNYTGNPTRQSYMDQESDIFYPTGGGRSAMGGGGDYRMGIDGGMALALHNNRRG